MKTKSTIFLLLSTFLFICSCIEKTVMDPRERTVVVDCVITNEEKLQTVNLYYSSYVSEIEYPKVEEAEVKMSFALDTTYTIIVRKDEEIVVDIDTSGCYEFAKVADGVWQAEFEPIEYARYNLEVKVPGEDSITILTATTDYPTKMDLRHPYGTVNDPYATAAAYYVTTGEDCKMWVYGLDYNPETSEYSVAEYIYTNHINADNFNVTGVTKENIKEFKRPENFDWYDDYLQSDISVMLPCFLFEWSFDYGEEIVLPLEDGRIRRFHDIWPNDLRYDFHDRYLRLDHSGNRGNNGLWKRDDTYIENKYFTIVVNFKPYKYHYSHPLSHLVFETVSDDLDEYFTDLIIMEQSTSDITMVWGRYNIHSNIKNGEGIFGAVYRCRSPWCYHGDYFYLD